MEYIVFDLEFNQGFDRKLNKTVSDETCPFEIIQIGAVKLDSNLDMIDTFNTFVKPNIYKVIHPFIKKMSLAFLKHLTCLSLLSMKRKISYVFGVMEI